MPGKAHPIFKVNLHHRYEAEDSINNILGRLDVRIVEFGYITKAMPWTLLGENSDPWFRLYYMDRESACLKLQDRTVELKPGHLHLIPPQLVFRYDLSRLASHLWIHFFSDTLQQILPCQIYSVPFDGIEQLKQLMGNTMPDVCSTTESIVEVNHLCRTLLNNFLQNPDFLAGMQYFSIPLSLKRVVDYIKQNCDTKITIAELAKIARMPPVQFVRQFVKYYHMTPKEFCGNARIDQAKTLLMQTELSTKEIAEKCGFSDCYHFYHYFKKVTSMTPSNYRRFNKAIPE